MRKKLSKAIGILIVIALMVPLFSATPAMAADYCSPGSYIVLQGAKTQDVGRITISRSNLDIIVSVHLYNRQWGSGHNLVEHNNPSLGAFSITGPVTYTGALRDYARDPGYAGYSGSTWVYYYYKLDPSNIPDSVTFTLDVNFQLSDWRAFDSNSGPWRAYWEKYSASSTLYIDQSTFNRITVTENFLRKNSDNSYTQIQPPATTLVISGAGYSSIRPLLTEYNYLGHNSANQLTGPKNPSTTVAISSVTGARDIFYYYEPIPCAATYDGNGGITTVADVNSYVYGDLVTVLGPGNLNQSGGGAYTVRNGYIFDSWNTRPDGAGQSYTGGGAFNITNNTALYAKWELKPPLGVDKTANKSTAIPGELITYTIRVENKTNEPQHNIVLTDSMPGITLRLVSPNPLIAISGNTAVIGTLAPGETVAFIYNYRTPIFAPNGEVIFNEATVVNDQGHSAKDSGEVRVARNLAVEKTADREFAMRGENVIYTVNVKNIGAGTLTDVTVADSLPGMSLISVSPSSTSYTVNKNQVTIASIAAGGAVALVYSYTIPQNLPDGYRIKNTATVFDRNGNNDEASCVVAVGSQILFEKTANASLYAQWLKNSENDITVIKKAVPSTGKPGDIINYEIIVTNNGSAGVTNLMVADSLDLNLFSANSGVFTFGNKGAIDRIPSVGSITFTSLYEIPSDAKTGDIIQNVFFVTDGAGGSISDEATVTVDGEQFLVLYNANGGSGAPFDGNNPYSLNDGAIVKSGGTTTRPNYEFKGWATNQNGAGTLYHGGEGYTVTEDAVFYAQWERKTVLEIVKTADKVQAEPGETINYSVTLKHIGDATLYEIPVSDSLPNIQLSSASTAVSMVNGSNEAVIMVLNPSETVIFTYSYTVPLNQPDGSKISNTFTASDPSPDGRNYTDTVTVDVKCRYHVFYDKNAQNASGEVTDGDQYAPETWVLTKDRGNIVRADHSFAGWNTDQSGDGIAYAEGTPFLILEDTTLYAQWDKNPQLAVRKSASVNTFTGMEDSAKARPGDVITYTVEVENIGSSTIANVEVADYIPDSLADVLTNVILSSGDPRVTPGNPAIIDYIVSGEIITLIYDVIVPNGAVSGSRILNKVVADDFTGNKVKDYKAIDIITSLMVTKTAMPDLTNTGGTIKHFPNPVRIGSSVKYNICVKNAGSDITLVDILLIDSMEGITLQLLSKPFDTVVNIDRNTAEISGLKPGEEVRFEYNFVIPRRTIMDSKIVNTVIAMDKDGNVDTSQAEVNVLPGHDFTVTYNGNGNTDGSVPTDPNTYSANASVTILDSNTLYRTGYTFSGWALNRDAIKADYQPGQSFSIKGNTVLYAIWVRSGGGSGGGGQPSPGIQYTLVFESNGGSHIDSIAAPRGTVIDVTVYIPAREGYIFSGWHLDKTLSNKVSSVTLNSNMTVYARWTKGILDPKRPDNEGVKGLVRDDHFAYIRGYPDGSVRPDRSMTRAEAAQMLYNLLADKAMGGVTSTFTDVGSGEWYYTAVTALATKGIINGYADGTFKPDGYMTRAEFTTMLSRFANLKSGTATFTDVGTNHWAYGYISNSSARRWVEGYPDGTFRPDQRITRSEVIKMINLVLDRFADEEFIGNSDNIKEFVDLNDTHWAYYTIMEAANAHGFERQSNFTEKWLR